MVIAILIPKVGGIVEMVLSTAAIAGGSLFAPLIWSLFSKKQTAKSIVFASIVSLVVSIWMKIGAPFIMGIRLDRFLETCLGVGLPLAILALFELINRKQHYAAFSKKEESIHEYNERQDSVKQNIFGIKVIAFSITLVGFGIALLGIGADDGLVAVIVGAGIMLGGGAIWKSILSAQ
ncbi:hypothetical protein QT327_20650 [Olivibacter sp. 47]|nr:hypothetical protein [Olivibacter sp. 47]MDM8176725.1 hypothetical protein [Olivibacter sp. 47]